MSNKLEFFHELNLKQDRQLLYLQSLPYIFFFWLSLSSISFIVKPVFSFQKWLRVTCSEHVPSQR